MKYATLPTPPLGPDKAVIIFKFPEREQKILKDYQDTLDEVWGDFLRPPYTHMTPITAIVCIMFVEL